MVSGRTPTAVASSDTRSARATVGSTAKTLDLGAGSKVNRSRLAASSRRETARGGTPPLDSPAPGRGRGSAAARGAVSGAAALAALVVHGRPPPAVGSVVQHGGCLRVQARGGKDAPTTRQIGRASCRERV